MQLKYVVHEQPGILGRSYFFGTWYHVGHLGETVYENNNSGLAIRLGQICDQVGGDLLPGPLK